MQPPLLIYLLLIKTSADCDCKQVTEKSPPARHVVRHVSICLEINFHRNRNESRILHDFGGHVGFKMTAVEIKMATILLALL